jgi:probable F420-dependent oxidoreductase
MDLGSVGVWWSGFRGAGSSLDAEAAHVLEELGYGAIWSSGGFDSGLSPRFAQLLEATDRIVVASGIVSIWVTPPDELARAASALTQAHPDRFLLGLGASHAPLVEHYERPYSHMVAYLDALDALDAATPRVAPADRVLAALGSKMLELAARRSAGAHPYFVPVEHTRRAREILGTGPLLAPEVTVVVEADLVRARELARSFTPGYLALPNYANNLRSLGFTEADLSGAGSDRLVDAVVAHGDAEAVADHVRAHHEAGADHVCLQVVSASGGFPLAEYRALADALL